MKIPFVKIVVVTGTTVELTGLRESKPPNQGELVKEVAGAQVHPHVKFPLATWRHNVDRFRLWCDSDFLNL